jgi:hypothetical protein
MQGKNACAYIPAMLLLAFCPAPTPVTQVQDLGLQFVESVRVSKQYVTTTDLHTSRLHAVQYRDAVGSGERVSRGGSSGNTGEVVSWCTLVQAKHMLALQSCLLPGPTAGFLNRIIHRPTKERSGYRVNLRTRAYLSPNIGD